MLQDISPHPALPSSSTVPVNASMQSEATITFTQPGVQPPVYVVTSLSTPPWAPLELKTNKEKTPSGDLIFELKFANVAKGSYQYKIRIGEGHWVVDESKESATDEHGNRNNVVHVKAATSHVSLDRTANVKDALDRKDSTIDTNDVSPAPIPFVVVEKVEDKAQPEYGDVRSKSLTVNETKRAADPEPDFEETKTDSPLDLESVKSPETPLIMVEKVDDKPAHGDDFGDDATRGQKLAHEMRSADASPDRLIISPEEPDELEPSEMRAPLFRHESLQDSGESLPEPAMDVIEEESTHSSTDHTSSGDIINTPSAESPDGLQADDELGHGPLLSHETSFEDKGSKPRNAPLLSHETGPGAKDNDEEDDEFDAAPLLPHETGFSSYEAARKNSRLGKDEYDYEPDDYMQYGNFSDDGEDFRELDHAPAFSHEQDLLAEDYGAPLLPHERGLAAKSFSGSERSFSLSPTTYEAPNFGRELDTHRESYGGPTHHAFFRTRTSSSTLPDKLPQSDAEDTNLHDPGLEHFPIGREQILERVATIGNKLPEDETHGAPTSPQSSVFSQACSSVDLVPVKSHISLASVREDEEEEDDDEDNADVESLGSPVTMSYSSSRFARDEDPLATPHPDDSKQLGFTLEDKPETRSTRSAEFSGAGSVNMSDRAKDRGRKDLSDVVASRATVKNTLSPPLTPRALEALGKTNTAPLSEPGLRQRRGAAEEIVDSDLLTPRLDKEDDADLVASAAEKLPIEKRPLQSWKGASIGISTVVAVAAACYCIALLR